MASAKLWLLKQTGQVGYDDAAGFVVRALTETQARELASQQFGDEGEETWLQHATSTCEKLSHSGGVGIILTDFRAG